MKEMNDAKPRSPGAAKPSSLFYSPRTLAFFGLFVMSFLVAPRLAKSEMVGSSSYGFPLTFERIDRAPPPFARHELDPQALLVDVIAYYVAAVALAAAAGALRRAR